MKNNVNETSTFEMIVESENSIAIKRVYPDNLSTEEIEKAEKEAPTVVLHCFDPAKVQELQQWGEKIAMRHLQMLHTNPKRKSRFLTALKHFF